MGYVRELLCFIAFTAVSALSSQIYMSTWRVQKSVQLDNQESISKARSKLECAAICGRLATCLSVAFDRLTKDCYFHPTGQVNLSTALNTMSVYTNTNPSCKERLLPNANIKWKRSLTSLEGNVTCQNDYILAVDNETMYRCLPNGLWENGTVCNQRYFRNPALYISHKIPRVVKVGWAACIYGMPTENMKVTVKLTEDNASNLMYMDFRINAVGYVNTLLLIGVINNVNVNSTSFTITPFLAANQTFTMVFVATSANLIKIIVNNVTWTTYFYQHNLSLVTGVFVGQQVNATGMDLWC